MRRTPQFMRNYLAKCEEINMEIDSWFIRSCMTSSVLFPIRWVAPPPKFFKICFLQLLQLDILEDFDFCPQQHSPIVFVLQDLCLQLGECDRTLLSVLTYPVHPSEVCVHLKLQSFTSWSFNPANHQADLSQLQKSWSLHLKNRQTMSLRFSRSPCLSSRLDKLKAEPSGVYASYHLKIYHAYIYQTPTVI